MPIPPTRALIAPLALVATLLLAAPPAAHAQAGPEAAAPEPDPARDERLKERTQVTQGSVQLAGRRLAYRAEAGLLQIDDRKEEPSAVISYVAYFGQAAASAPARPVVFLYNGGPGSSTVWLHLGAFGPKRVLTANGAPMPAAPYRLVDNEHTLLDVADLVFIDAPGTGFGRIVAVDRSKAREREKLKDKEKEFFGVDQDAQAFGRFIHKFLARHQLWNAPKFLFGESYGTLRSVVLAQQLHADEAVDVNGVLLLSQTLNLAFSPDEPQHGPGVDQPYALALPTYAATAWYHDRLPAWRERGPAALERLLAAARRFALEEYLPALQAGAAIEPARRREIAAKLEGFTGLPAAYLERAELRINGPTFSNQLLADEGATVGRLDTRYRGPSLDRLAKEASHDPQGSAISSAYVSAYNDYARQVLKVEADLPYRPFAEVGSQWDWRHQPPGAREPVAGTTNVMPDLAAVLRTHQRLRVASFLGYYDLATPFFAAEHEFAHLAIPPEARRRIEIHHYPAGHMMYDDPASLKALHDDVARFLRETLAAP